jgi:hypothetical protein
MAHFVKLDNNNVVLEVHLVANEALDPHNEEVSGVAFLNEWSNGYANWKQTSYNNNIRKQYAGIGYSYDPIADVFIAPQPFASWLLDKNFDWQAPTPRPNEGEWYWNEENLMWQQLEN